jgi:hypothetical protein
MPKARRVRTTDERLQLFDRHVRELVTESASLSTPTIVMDFKEWKFGGTTPEREALRSYILAVRNLDSERFERDLFLPNVMTDFESFALTLWATAWMQPLRDEYTWINTHADAFHAGRGWLTLRDQFELLAYADHIHRNADLEDTLKAMLPFVRRMTLDRGHNYALRITNLAVKLQAIGRVDPALQHLFEPGEVVPLRDTTTHGVIRFP